MAPPSWTRRRALATAGSLSLSGLLAACGNGSGDGAAAQRAVTTEEGGEATVQPRSTPSRATAQRFDDAGGCRLSTELTEGPYYFDVDAIRRDITEDREGTPLRLGVRVRDAGSCEPLENAVVDVWHCDAGGSYSGFEAASGGGGPGGGPTDDETYLRGAQVTDAEGIVEFRTIYPGAYPGRAVHVHAKVHLDRSTLLTTQFFFDDGFSDRVFEAPAYGSAGRQRLRNDGDGIYDRSLELTLSEEGDGVLGLITLDVQRT